MGDGKADPSVEGPSFGVVKFLLKSTRKEIVQVRFFV